ncbi:MAG: phosphate acetyltransferase [Actinomycetia bacterium]|nr:phosphate acetyltransferase [Actinomycetes bacterium]
MTTVVYVTSVEPNSGKSLVSLGALEIAASQFSRVGYFRPVIAAGPARDPIIELMRSRYQLAQSYEQSFGVTTEATRGMGDHVRPALVHAILAAFEDLAAKCEIVIVEGTDYSGASAAFEFSLNAEVAANLAASVVVVARGHDRRPDQVSGSLTAARISLIEHKLPILGFVVNRIDPQQWDEMARIGAALPDYPVWLLPEDPALSKPSLLEVQAAVSADLVSGSQENLGREVGTLQVAAMTLPHLMQVLRPDTLLVTSGDRADVILLALTSGYSTGVPGVAGLLLTGGFEPPEAVLQFAEGMTQQPVPILACAGDVFEVAEVVAAVEGSIASGEERKIASALKVFEDRITVSELAARLSRSTSATVTPVMFERQLLARAQQEPKRIVLPEGNDDRVLQAADQLLRRDVVELAILGQPDEIRSRAEHLGLDLAKAELIDPETSELRPELAARLYQLRSHKGLTAVMADDLVTDVSWFGTLLVESGRADGMVSGATHTTADTIRPALQVIRTKPEVSVVSSAFFMAMPDRVLVFADCAVIPDPDARELADIALSSAATARAFNVDPRVAMLSYSTGGSGSGQDVAKVAEATALVRARNPQLLVEGPVQYDAAVDPGVAAAKLPNSDVAGKATVLIFPDLNTGNNTYKAVQRSSGAVAIGPILQGLRLPVNDLSRGATVADIVNTIVITAIQAQGSPHEN